MKSFEAKLLAQGAAFVCGDEPSIADFQLFAEFLDVHYVGITFDEFPHIQKWHDACRGVPGIKEVHEKFDSVLPNIKAMFGV